MIRLLIEYQDLIQKNYSIQVLIIYFHLLVVFSPIPSAFSIDIIYIFDVLLFLFLVLNVQKLLKWIKI